MNQPFPFLGELWLNLELTRNFIQKQALILTLIMSGCCASAQDVSGSKILTSTADSTKTKQLKSGDIVPEHFWSLPIEVLSRNKTPRFSSLNDYRDKLLILDFWATWCAPCVKAFPKLNKLQKTFGDDIKILSITDEDRKTVQRSIKSNEYLNGNNIPLIINDDLTSGISAYFPKRMIPHVAVIKNGKVQIVTEGNAITKPNIEKLLMGDIAGIPIKDDQMEFNQFKPLLVDGNGGSPGNFNFRSLLTERISGVGSGFTRFSYKETKQIGYKVTNANLKSAWGIIFPKLSFTPPNHVFYPTGFTKMRDSIFCYEIIVPKKNSGKIKDLVQRDLIGYFGLTGKFIRKEIKCLILKPTKNDGATIDFEIHPRVFRDNRFAGRPAGNLVSRLNWGNSKLPPVINEANSQVLPANNLEGATTISDVNKWLSSVGLQIVPGTRTVEIFQFETLK